MFHTSFFKVRASLEILASTVEAANLAETYDLDMSLSRNVVTPKSAETVAMFKTEKAYGFSNWVVEGANDIEKPTDDAIQTALGNNFKGCFRAQNLQDQLLLHKVSDWTEWNKGRLS